MYFDFLADFDLVKSIYIQKIVQNIIEMNDKSNNIISKLLGKESVIEPLIVCPEGSQQSSLRTIKEALQKVVRGGVIKLMPGVYRQNIIINRGQIKIQAFHPNSNVIIINGSHPSIIIDLESDKDTVGLESIKFAHHANISPETVQNQIDGVYMNDQINCFNMGDTLNTILYIKRGKAIVQECKFSLNVINSDNNSIIPSITIEKHGFLIMTRCQLFGSTNSTKETIGVLSKKGSAIIKQCEFIAHQRAAIYLSGTSDTIFTFCNSKIHHCHNGVVLIGDFKASCQNIGIKMGMCNKSKISYNSIIKNKVGIYFQNADPLIQNNTILFSKTDGIVCHAKDMIKCDGEIKFNQIRQSKEVGIKCSGSLNEVRICNNQQITFNGKCGIFVENGAHPFIFRNKIQKNLGQGILITEGSSAFIQKNQILNNLKSNIALGGKHSINTTIINNKILSSRCQGIFMIYAQKLLLSGNEISKNHDGIIAITSIPIIQQNKIIENESNGILMLKNCKARIFKNIIQQNKDAGLFLKSGSYGMVCKNQFKENKYQLIIQEDHPMLKHVDSENSFQGEVRIPQNYRCNLI